MRDALEREVTKGMKRDVGVSPRHGVMVRCVGSQCVIEEAKGPC